ncbi:MAG: alanine--glyoxylate aminotransferase family protein, partial [Candidatus Omnitrophota bacterium]
MKKNYLLTPGPTPLPPEVCQALGRPIIHHRTPQFQEILKQVGEDLKYVFNTANDVFILASSGTGAMEAAVANLLSPGDSVITVEGGKFGERWTEICQAYGVNAEVIKVPWGEPVALEDIKSRLNKSIKAVFTTFCETSTGCVFDIQAIGKVVKSSQAVLVVDAISGLGGMPLLTDAWSCDVVVCGSQKGLMLPPGLGFISLSPKAWDLVKQSKCPKYYFDLKFAKKALDKTDTPYTSAISLIIALKESLRMIKEEGLENIFSRHKKMAEATRKAADALGLKLFAPKASSDVVTAIMLPPSIDGVKLVKTMRDTCGITIAGGQGKLKGKIIRIAH